MPNEFGKRGPGGMAPQVPDARSLAAASEELAAMARNVGGVKTGHRSGNDVGDEFSAWNKERKRRKRPYIILGLILILILPGTIKLLVSRAISQRIPSNDIFIAVQQHDVASLKAAIAAKTDPNLRDGVGMTPLIEAAQGGKLASVQALIAAGADVNASASGWLLNGSTPLMLASRVGYPEVVQALLAAGADPKAVSPKLGRSALTEAATTGQLDVVRALISAGADPNDTHTTEPPLYWAALEGHLEVAQALVAAGAHLNGQGSDTPLNAAIYNHHQDVVDWLRAQGAS